MQEADGASDSYINFNYIKLHDSHSHLILIWKDQSDGTVGYSEKKFILYIKRRDM